MKNIITNLFVLIFVSFILVSCIQNNSREKEQAVMESTAKVKEREVDSINRHDSILTIEASNIASNSNQEQNISDNEITDLETYKYNKGKSDLKYDFAAAIRDGTSLPDINQQALHLKAYILLISKSQFIKESKCDAKTAGDYYDRVIIPAYNKFKYHKFNIIETSKSYAPNTPMFRQKGLPSIIYQYAKTRP